MISKFRLKTGANACYLSWWPVDEPRQFVWCPSLTLSSIWAGLNLRHQHPYLFAVQSQLPSPPHFAIRSLRRWVDYLPCTSIACDRTYRNFRPLGLLWWQPVDGRRRICQGGFEVTSFHLASTRWLGSGIVFLGRHRFLFSRVTAWIREWYGGSQLLTWLNREMPSSKARFWYFAPCAHCLSTVCSERPPVESYVGGCLSLPHAWPLRQCSRRVSWASEPSRTASLRGWMSNSVGCSADWVSSAVGREV